MKLLIFKNKKNTKIKAFTLLEVLASFSIVTMVILGPLTSAINSASYARQTKDIITATYLAEEAIELLHHHRDSIYLQCINIVGACNNTVPDIGSETYSEKAWRIFKSQLVYGSVSCYLNGCSYDFLDMINVSTNTPIIYSPISNECSYLSLVSSTVLGIDTHVRNYYVCSGINTSRLKDNFFSIKKTSYTRKITIQSVPTFETTPLPVPNTPNLGLYYDDLVVTSEVSYIKSNGVVRVIKVIDFLHSK